MQNVSHATDHSGTAHFTRRLANGISIDSFFTYAKGGALLTNGGVLAKIVGGYTCVPVARRRTVLAPSEGTAPAYFPTVPPTRAVQRVACLVRQIGGAAPSSPARINPSPVGNRNKFRMAAAGF